MSGSDSEVECYRQRRHIASLRVLNVLVVGTGVQVGGWVIAAVHPAVEATMILGAMLAMVVATALLLPFPPGGLLWPWQRAARERHAAARARRTSRYDGLDRLAVVGIFMALLLWQVFNNWLQSSDSDLTTVLLVTLAVALSGTAVLYGVLEVRRRAGRATAPPQKRSAHPVPPGIVELQRRADREHRHEPT